MTVLANVSDPSNRVLFPRSYFLYILLASVDVLLTWYILETGGSEINAIAQWAIELAGEYGMTALKFLTVAFVLVVCEIVGRQKLHYARFLAAAAIVINMVPPVWALAQYAGLLQL